MRSVRQISSSTDASWSFGTIESFISKHVSPPSVHSHKIVTQKAFNIMLHVFFFLLWYIHWLPCFNKIFHKYVHVTNNGIWANGKNKSEYYTHCAKNLSSVLLWKISSLQKNGEHQCQNLKWKKEMVKSYPKRWSLQRFASYGWRILFILPFQILPLKVTSLGPLDSRCNNNKQMCYNCNVTCEDVF